MILATVTREKDDTFSIYRWTKEPKKRAVKTHGATTPDTPSAAQVEQFRAFPPDTLRLT